MITITYNARGPGTDWGVAAQSQQSAGNASAIRAEDTKPDGLPPRARDLIGSRSEQVPEWEVPSAQCAWREAPQTPSDNATRSEPSLAQLTEAALHGITRALASVGRAFVCLDPSFRNRACLETAQ